MVDFIFFSYQFILQRSLSYKKRDANEDVLQVTHLPVTGFR